MFTPKDNHEAATFPAMPTDATGIKQEGGMAIAWFKDPAGNVPSVVSA